MLPLVPNLQIQLVWLDSHMNELRLCASSANFCGCVNFYAGFSELPDLATLLAGFPTDAADVRTVEFGAECSPDLVGASVKFFCRDSSGHLVAQVSVFAAPGRPKDIAQSAVVQIDTVPAEIDSFIEQLRGMGSEVGSIATLKRAV